MKTIFEGQVDSPKRINLLYDDVEQHYHVIVNITGTMAKRFMCNACNKSSASDATHRCEQTCRDCMARPPCVFTAVRIPVQRVIDISGAKHVSRTTHSLRRTRNLFASARDVAVPVERY